MTCSLLRQRLRRLRRDRRGVAALEFAVIGLVMVTVMLAAWDFGNAAQEQIALQQAVRAGAAYVQNYPAATKGDIQTAVTNAVTNEGLTLSGAPSVTCSCKGAAYTCGTPPAACAPPVTVIISATTTYTPITSLFAGVIPNNNASYEVRIQ
jgi:Flp pilus assembly protein TadG